MALAMATPWLHPRSGIYYLRRRVPDELKVLVGSGEIRRSLGTRDPKEAKRLFPAALAALEEQWANLRDGPQALSEQTCIEMAVRIGEGFLTHHREAPSQQTQWSVDFGEDLFKQPKIELDLTKRAVDLITEGFDPHAIKRAEMRAWCEDTADRYLAQNGLRVDAGSRSDFVWAIADATQAAALSLRELSQGARRAFVGRTATAPFPMTENRSTRVPAVRATSERAEQAAAISFETLITGWLRERQPALKTAYVFPRTVREFIAFVGHDDAAAVREDDLIRWKDALLGKELRGSTIRNGKIGPVRTILQWGVDNKKLSTNVARGIKVQPEVGWREQLLETLGQIHPAAFERLCQRLLREAGFTRVEVTGKTGDGGIDGTGFLRMNLLSFQVIFQCKRWKGSVGAATVRDFRGAMVGRADKGLILTTAAFTADARREATRDGAPAIDLVDGEALCDLLKLHRIGLTVKMVEEITLDHQALSAI